MIIILAVPGGNPNGNGVIQLSYYGRNSSSTSLSYGVVQIFINNGWSNIYADQYYGQNEADVICHQLGYTGASTCSYSRAELV